MSDVVGRDIFLRVCGLVSQGWGNKVSQTEWSKITEMYVLQFWRLARIRNQSVGRTMLPLKPIRESFLASF